MLWRFIIAGTKEHFEGHKHPQPPQRIHLQAWGVVAHHLTHQHGVQGLMWGARGPFPLAAAMVVAVVTPVLFVLRLLKKEIKTLKLVGGYQKVNF